MVEKERPEVWDILEEVIREHPVLLNRAPTLHRLGIQAFEPVLIEGKAIQLHPLVCTAFNADFDGDQMAVHVPLSLEAQLEARVLMMSTNNILSPGERQADHRAVAGHRARHLLPHAGARRRAGRRHRCSPTSARSSMRSHKQSISLHAKIKARLEADDDKGVLANRVVETTPGRMLLAQILPKHPNVPFSLINRLLTKKDLPNVIDAVYRHCGQKETRDLRRPPDGPGLRQACQAGISFGKDDLIIPDAKEKLVAQTQEEVKEYEQQYQDGLITAGEKYNKVVDAWSRCTDEVAEAMMKEHLDAEARPADQLGVDDGALRCARLAGADEAARRHARPDGQAVGRDHRDADHLELQGRPVRAGVLQLHPRRPQGPGRHRAEDRQLRLPDAPPGRRGAGLHHRRGGLRHRARPHVRRGVDGGEVVAPLSERILGRTAAEDVVDPLTGTVIVQAGDADRRGRRSSRSRRPASRR